MEIRIVDRERHYVRKSAYADKGDPFEVMDDLLAGTRSPGQQGLDNANPAVEYECDWEFWDTLAAVKDGRLAIDGAPWHEAHKGTYRNTPIMVMGDEPERAPPPPPEKPPIKPRPAKPPADPETYPHDVVRTTKDPAP